MSDETENPQEGLEPPTVRSVRAKANGFAQGKHIAPVLKTTTERWEASMNDDLDRILRKMRRAWERGLDSDSEKIAVDTAHKLSGHLYRPETRVKVEHSGDAGGNTYNVVNVDALSAEERALLVRAQKYVDLDVRMGEVIDAEVVEDE